MLPGILVDDIEARTQGMAMLKLEDFVISSYDARGPSIASRMEIWKFFVIAI